jgi:hypothetical protein
VACARSVPPAGPRGLRVPRCRDRPRRPPRFLFATYRITSVSATCRGCRRSIRCEIHLYRSPGGRFPLLA